MTADPDANFVELRQCSLAYSTDSEQVLALADTTMSIRRGEFVAVVGPSGCGKSTLMKLVTGLMPATTGEVRVRGQKVSAPIKGVGMAFQNSTLMPWRTTLQNVMLPLEIVEPYRGRLRAERKEFEAKAERLLESVGLGGFGQRYPWQLSGGMQQRSNLCRALIHEPEIMMLDEPFGALDAFTREELWGIMQQLWIERRFTAILVTHDLREAVYLADTVYVMSRRPGRILYRHEIVIPRPRTLETTFEPHFVDIVHKLRDQIHREHGA